MLFLVNSWALVRFFCIFSKSPSKLFRQDAGLLILVARGILHSVLFLLPFHGDKLIHSLALVMYGDEV